MKKGFTLIELLGILVLLGVIIIVAMPSLIRTNKIAFNNKTKDSCDIIKSACESYRVVEANSGGVSVRTLIEKGYLNNNVEMPNGMDEDTVITIDAECHICE